MKTRVWPAIASASLVLGLGSVTHPQEARAYPNKPIQLLVAQQAGSGIDLFFRLVAEDLQKIWKANVTVQNRTGAAGAIAASAVSTAAKDGYTIFGGLLSPLTAMTVANPGGTVHLLRDFDPVAVIYGYGAVIMVVKADSKFRSLEDVVDEARKRPGELTGATGVVGSNLYLELELLKRLAKVKLTTLPLPGSVDGVTNLLGGHVDFTMTSDIVARTYIHAGRIRALATDIRSRLFPDVPTFAEKGYPEIDLVPSLVILGPKGLPREIVDTWEKALKVAANDARLLGEMSKLSLNFNLRTGTAELTEMLKKEVEKYSRFTKEELGWK